MRSYTIHDLPVSEKPRERLKNCGSLALSDVELLAIILRVGGKDNSALLLAQKMISEFGSLFNLLSASIQQLSEVKNVGIVKATTLKAVFEISRRVESPKVFKKTLSKPKDVFNLIKTDFKDKKRENLFVVSLDVRNKFIAKDVISIGAVDKVLVYPREVFRQALLRNAVRIILVHNHPSGDPTPSSADILLTEEVAKVGATLGVALLDHVVITDQEFVSMRALDLFEVEKFSMKGGD